MNRWRLLFIFFGQKSLLQFYDRLYGRSDINVRMLKQIEEMKELRIPSIVLSRKDDVLLPVGEAKYKLVFGRQRRNF